VTGPDDPDDWWEQDARWLRLRAQADALRTAATVVLMLAACALVLALWP
jgi:hypothetical protein